MTPEIHRRVANKASIDYNLTLSQAQLLAMFAVQSTLSLALARALESDSGKSNFKDKNVVGTLTSMICSNMMYLSDAIDVPIPTLESAYISITEELLDPFLEGFNSDSRTVKDPLSPF